MTPLEAAEVLAHAVGDRFNGHTEASWNRAGFERDPVAADYVKLVNAKTGVWIAFNLDSINRIVSIVVGRS